MPRQLFVFYVIILNLLNIYATDITDSVFSKNYEGVIAAYGDFDSNELTDVFVIRDDFKTIEILLAHESPPLLRRNDKYRCHYPHLEITSIVPGDFDGDALMDVMFTARKKGHQGKREVDVYVNYGGLFYMNCTTKNDSEPVISSMLGEPLAFDYGNNMIIDLFGQHFENETEKRSFWIFNKQRDPPVVQNLDENVGENKLGKLTHPHSHATIDLNDDGLADLSLSTDKGFEVWIADKKTKNYHYEYTIAPPTGHFTLFGQAIYIDIELNGTLTQVIPVCFDHDCKDSRILAHSENHYKDLQINFFEQDDNKTQWGFLPSKDDGKFYEKTITLRAGDFNNDGYPDLLATLQRKDKSDTMIQTFLLENVKSTNIKSTDKIRRTFAVRWTALNPFGKNTIMASFYDFYQDGILDVIMVQKNDDKYTPLAFRNTLDYDANFVKVIVLTGLENSINPSTETLSIVSKSKSYGSNLPGPKIKYHTTTQEGLAKHGAATQLAQSAHFSLHLPYQIFGLGRTPNFVDNVEIMFAGKSKTWPQIIPNSQMLVIPKNPEYTATWKAQLFVTPSKIIIQSVIALLGICFIILIIILGLHLKERREDKLEKLQEAQRFHFDAM